MSFPVTRLSVVRSLTAPGEASRRQAWDDLLAAYWRPVYKYLRIRWSASAEEAEDLTQSFFAHAFETDAFAGYDPERARFRTYLRLCLDRDVANARQAAARHKRGGGAPHLPLDFAGAERELVAVSPEVDPEELFHREWVRGLFTSAGERVRASCAGTPRKVRFTIFARYDLRDGASTSPDGPSYAELARELGLPVTQITNHLSWARRELRRHVLEELRRQTGSEREFREEARRLLGVDPPEPSAATSPAPSPTPSPARSPERP